MAFDAGSAIEVNEQPEKKKAPFDPSSAVEDTTVQKSTAATVTSIASKFNPDEVAQLRYLGRQTGTPDDIAERNPEAIKRKALSLKVEQLYDNSPVTGRKLADPAFSKITHDITDELVNTESSIKNLSLSAKPMRAAGNLVTDTNINKGLRGDFVQERDILGNLGLSVVGGLVGAKKGVYGNLQSASESTAAIPRVVQSALGLVPGLSAVTALTPNYVRDQATKAAEYFSGLGQEASAEQRDLATQRNAQSTTEAAIYSGIESGIQNVLMLPLAYATRNPALLTGAMSAGTYGQSYVDATEKGLSPLEKVGFSSSQFAVEYLTEVMPTGALMKILNGTDGFIKKAGEFMIKEVGTEQIATLWQDLNEWAVLNPDKPISEYLAARPDAAYQTLVATLVGGGVQIGAAKAIGAATNAAFGVEQESQKAESTLQAFANIQQLAEQSKLKQRSAQDFGTFLQEAGGENGIDEVFVDARKFAEEAEALGVDVNTLMQASPAIQKQLEEAISQGVDLVIPVGEFGSVIAGTDFGANLIQHLRADENSLSAFEAKTQLDDAVNNLQSKAMEVANKQGDTELWKSELSEVGNNITTQLNSVGRFTPENNQAYVNGIVAPWYSTLASDLGITPKEAFARYPLQVSGDITSSGFEQGIQYPLAEKGTWYADEDYAVRGASLKYITPDEYIASVRPLDIDEISRENIDDLKEHIKSGRPLDPLTRYADGKEDGRHRAYAAKELGIKYVPVLDFGNAYPDAPSSLNNLNQSISQTETPQFKAWFGDSKVVDAEGKPLVVYRGLTTSYQEKDTPDISWTTPSKEYANEYAQGENSQVSPLFVSIKKPFNFGFRDLRVEVPITEITSRINVRMGSDASISNEQIDAAYKIFKEIKSIKGFKPVWLWLQTEPKIRESLIAAGFDGIEAFEGVNINDNDVPTYGAFFPTQIKSAIGNNGNFDPNDANILKQGDVKELIAQHNLSADNLLFADRMGGLAVPSLAVTKKQHILEGFGEITLLAAPEMVDPKGYAKAKVFGADIYSPRYPQITYQYDRKVLQGLQDMFADAIKATGERSIDEDKMEDNPHDALRYNTATKYQFLKENGIEPKTVAKKLSEEQITLLERLAPFISKNIDVWSLTQNKEFIKAYIDLVQEKYVAAGVDARAWNEEQQYNIAKDGAYKLRDAVQSSNDAIDRYATQDAINSQFNKELSDKYQAYIDEIIKGLNAKEKLYNGRSPTGFKKYIDHTLENVVKALKKELRGGENWNYGLGSVRAKYTPEFKSIADIRKNKNRLMDNGNFEDVKNEMDDALQSVADGLEPFLTFSGSTLENTTLMLSDAAKIGIPRALEENGFKNVPAEMQNEVAEFLTHLRNMPTEYFEVKILRDVSITEFSGAVVPKNVDPRVLEVLQKNGVKDIRFYDESNPSARKDAISTFENLLFQKAEQKARGQIAFSNDITQGANITLLKNADASTFIHELGHFFLEVYADIASKPNAPQKIVDDMNQLLNWFGIEATPEQPQIDVWKQLSLDEKRPYHEKLARGFEQYAMEGNAPTLELSRMFAKLRDFMVSAYKNLKSFFERSGEPGLTDEVRQVFDRMLANSEAIERTQDIRGMFPLFASAEEAGMTTEEYADYIQGDQDATDEATAQLDARSLRDLKWLRNARSRFIRELQKEATDTRKQVSMEVRREVMSSPVYQAYAWLKQLPETKDAVAKKKKSEGVDAEVDSLFAAIAKLGGINRQLAQSEWGIDPKDKFYSGVFGKNVLVKEGGLSPDAMAEALGQYEYLSKDENGKVTLTDLEDKFFAEHRGDKQYSLYGESEMFKSWQNSMYGEGEDKPDFDSLGKGKLDLEVMKGRYGEDGDWRKLGVGRTGMVMTDGFSPELVAEYFGFTSGDHLVQSLIQAEKPADVIERLTDERMLNKFGDLVNQQSIQEAADKAVHNELRAKVLSTELAAQNKQLGNRRIIEAAAKAYAERRLGETVIKDIKPSTYTRAETKAAKVAENATKKGDTNTAVQAKRDQLLNNRSAKASMDALEEIKVTLRYLKKFDSQGTRKNLDIDYLEQIDDILNRFDLRSGQSANTIAKKQSLLDWIKSQEELGLSPVVDEKLLSELNKQSYKSLTLDDFRALADSIRNIEHLGRLKKKLLTARDQREFNDVVETITASIINNAKRTIPERKQSDRGRLVDAKEVFANFVADHRKFASLAREMDGWKDVGPVWDNLVRSMNERGDFEAVQREQATMQLSELIKPIMSGEKLGKKTFFASIGKSFTREEILGIALNMGNETNRERVMTGESLNNQQLQEVLSELSEQDWNFVQSIWDFIDGYWPQIVEKERRITGVEPKKVEASPVTTPFGTLRGGYYPIAYDRFRSERSAGDVDAQVAAQMQKGAYTRATTRRGHVEARTNSTGRPLRYDLGVIVQHVDQVIHDLAWHEWLVDANRLFNSTRIENAMRDHYGVPVMKTMKSLLNDIAVGENAAQASYDPIFNHLRYGSTIAGLGFNLSTALLQPLGLTQSITRIGAKWVGKGAAKWLGGAVRFESATKMIYEKSDFMRLRAKTMQREINEIRNKVSGNDSKLEAAYFYMIQKMQAIADVPTWLGMYEKAMAMPDMDEATAVALADQAVIDAQGGGQVKDLSKIQRGSPVWKIWTNFYSFFNTTYNLTAEVVGRTNFKDPKSTGLMVVDLALLYTVPAILGALMKSILKGEDDEDELARRLIAEQINYLFGTMVLLREIGAISKSVVGLQAPDYSGPAGVRIGSDIIRLGKQIAQGEADEAFWRSLNSVSGVLFHYPAGQVQRTAEGINALVNGKTNNPGVLVVGPPKDN